MMTRATYIARMAAAGAVAALLTASGLAAGSSAAAGGAPLFGARAASASEATLAALSDAQARYAAASAELDSLYDQVYQAQNDYDNTTYALEQTTQQIAQLQAQIEAERQELADAQDVLAARVAAAYKAGRGSELELLLGSTSFEDFESRVRYTTSIADDDARAIQEVKDIKAQLESDESALQAQKAQQEALQAQQAANLASLSEQTAQVQDYVASLDYEVQSLYAQAQAEAQAAAAAAAAAAQQNISSTMSASAAEAQAEAQEAISAASDAGYSYDEDTGSWTDSSGSYVSESTVSAATGYDVSSVIERAQSLTGTQYVWGGYGYSGTDCSGLTSYAYGGTLPHQSSAQRALVEESGTYTTDVSQLKAGDLVFYERSDGSTYHVAIYNGDGTVTDAIPNGGVQVRDINYVDGYAGGGTPSV